MKLAELIYYNDTNTVEATWVDKETNAFIKCQSYMPTQMDLLKADLGDEAIKYKSLMDKVVANIKPLSEVDKEKELEQRRKFMVLTKLQARLALLNISKLDLVESLVSGNVETKIWWDHANEIQRLHPRITGMAKVIGLTDETLDDLFIKGATLS